MEGGRKASGSSVHSSKNVSLSASSKNKTMADCAGIVELLYGFYYARLWLSVCLANIAVTAIFAPRQVRPTAAPYFT